MHPAQPANEVAALFNSGILLLLVWHTQQAQLGKYVSLNCLCGCASLALAAAAPIPSVMSHAL
jgi:hypothetical protein